MKDIFKKYFIDLSDYELEKFENFLGIFIDKNSQINLSSIRDVNLIVEKHFIDSIFLNSFLNLEGNVLDIGTGGGFPLIPLAITNKKVSFTGLDSTNKKINCVGEFVKDLGLKNVSLVCSRAEDLANDKKYREKFDFVISRATAFLPVLVKYCMPFLKIGGILCAYKIYDKQELDSTKKILIKFKAKIGKIKSYKIGKQERVIIFIKK